MNATSRYILTASAVAAGLLAVGATANAIAGSDDPVAPIGDPVVVPSSPALSDDSDQVEEIPQPSPSDLVSPNLERGGWATSPGSAGDDDDELEDESDDDQGPYRNGNGFEDEGEDD